MKIGDPLPKWSAPILWINGEARGREEWGNKATLIHFWSVSCYFCKRAMSELNQYRDFYQENLTVISVHFPRSEHDLDIELVKKTVAEYKMTQSIYVDHEFQLAKAFSNEYVPSYYLFDQNGKLRYYQAGGTNLKMLDTRISRVLNSPVDLT
ncbi:TlpA family protein disulfide reductase [Niallia sp. JL1B1071]|uniref:TlpA family protein disulfide reductase n=1 Tax=Niallia tiangongensis TaxID=3237105 RepID=UPI0037DC0116